MVLKYVLRNFSRRRVRTILMILALIVSTALIVTMSATVESVRQSNVDLIASQVGRYDLEISKQDTSPDPFIQVDHVSAQMLAADSSITAVHPRIDTFVEMSSEGNSGFGSMIALDKETDDIGFVDVLEGSYELGDGQAALFETSSRTFDLEVGDSFDVSYSFPVPREIGKPNAVGASERRTIKRFVVGSIVRQDGVGGGLMRDGLIVDLADVQDWLNTPGRVNTLVATVDQALYETNNPEAAALRVRDVVSAVQASLGDEYSYRLDKAAALSEVASAFMIIQALINAYGLIALGIVGLLIHTLVMTNVQEQRRELAILRILGSQRQYLFILVITEVLVMGVIGVGLGIVAGQFITNAIVVPLIASQMAQQGIPGVIAPRVSVSALWPVVVSALVVLILSSLKPARQAANTKVMHAINPGVADNIQIEDLARLRERNPDFKLFLGGLALMSIFALIAGFQVIETFGGPGLQVTFVLLAIGLVVLGLGLMFYIATVPFEKLVLLVMGLIMPKLTYFAKRNVGRGQTRNTLISMLVLFSAVLPSFLATTLALEQANFEANIRQDMGAPVRLQIFGEWPTLEEAARERLTSDFRTRELASIDGLDQSAGMSFAYWTHVSDPVDFKSAPVNVVGVDGSLNDVLFTDLVEFSEGGPEAFDRILAEKDSVIISEGLASHLAVSNGDIIKIRGDGNDHVIEARIIALATKIAGVEGIGRGRISGASGSTVLMSIDNFRALITEMDQPPLDRNLGVLEQVLLTLTPEAEAREVADVIGKRYNQDYRMWARFLEVAIEENQNAQGIQRIFLLSLTTIAFTTAVFGVFAVIYVTIYSRRIEIGMMKAMGMRRRELTGMLNIESITMTLGAALAGIAAGAAMGYIIFFGERALSQRPMKFAVDTTVIPFIVIMIVLASMIGATFSARRIVKKRAVEILRMQ